MYKHMNSKGQLPEFGPDLVFTTNSVQQKHKPAWVCKDGKNTKQALVADSLTSCCLSDKKRQRRGGVCFAGLSLAVKNAAFGGMWYHTNFYTANETHCSCRTLPGQRRSSHVSLYADRHGNASTADVAQLLWHRNTVAEVETQASILCVRHDTKQLYLYMLLLKHIIMRFLLG